jgi:predicted glycosyltransferase
MRPIVEVLSAEGHDVRVTARDYAQTVELLERFSIPHEVIGHHRGERLAAKAWGLAARSAALTRWALGERPDRGARGAQRRPFDVALGHGSNDVSVAATALRIPCSTMFDYEFAAVQHHVNCRLARTVVVPEAIPAERLFRYGARGKIAPYPGLKEEYYLGDFEPDAAVLDELSLDTERQIVVVRTPPELALYHRFTNDVFGEVIERLAAAARDRGVQVVALARTAAQRDQLRRYPELTLPEHAVDAQSLIAYADLVISGGGTMNREAVALGTPVLSTFQGRIGAVDERLIAEGRMQTLHAGSDLDSLLASPLARRGSRPPRTRRDPRLLAELLLSPTTRGGRRMSSSSRSFVSKAANAGPKELR